MPILNIIFMDDAPDAYQDGPKNVTGPPVFRASFHWVMAHTSSNDTSVKNNIPKLKSL